jgi:hypothetical protein
VSVNHSSNHRHTVQRRIYIILRQASPPLLACLLVSSGTSAVPPRISETYLHFVVSKLASGITVQRDFTTRHRASGERDSTMHQSQPSDLQGHLIKVIIYQNAKSYAKQKDKFHFPKPLPQNNPIWSRTANSFQIDLNEIFIIYYTRGCQRL